MKLGLQIVSVLPIVLLGYYVDRVVAFGYPIELGWLGIPLTVLWLVGCINALNLIDGMDGLASIVGLSTAAMMGVIAASEGHDHVAVMAIVLAASLLGFLIYNLPPASIFLGDSGSMVIGLSVGLLGIQGTLKTSATLAITAPAVVMTLPMFDIVAALVRRKLTGRRFDAPDRLHIHHRLLDRGWTPWQVLCLIGAVCLTTGRRRHGRHDLPPRRPGVDHRHDPGRADDPPAAVRLRGVRPGERSDRPIREVLRGVACTSG